jgi:hypothetical protein
MSLPQERPAFVLPWIAVILASFAALPFCFDGRDVTGGAIVGVPETADEALVSDSERLAPQVAPTPSLGTDWEAGRFGVAQAAPEVATTASLTEFDPGLESETLVGPPMLPPAERGSGAEQPEEARPSGFPQEPVRQPGLHRYQATPRLATEAARPDASRTPRIVPQASRRGDAAEREPARSPARALELSDGRTALRLTPATLGFLVGEGLLPRGVVIRPAIADELPSEPVDAESTEDPQTERKPTLADRRKRLKRLLVGDPTRLVEFLAILEPAQLRELVLELRGRGLRVERVLGF